MRAGAVESRAHLADRQLESLGHALVREVFPRGEQERLALAVRQCLDGVGHAREEDAGIECRSARAPGRRLEARRPPGARAAPLPPPPPARPREAVGPRRAGASATGSSRSRTATGARSRAPRRM